MLGSNLVGIHADVSAGIFLWVFITNLNSAAYFVLHVDAGAGGDNTIGNFLFTQIKRFGHLHGFSHC